MPHRQQRIAVIRIAFTLLFSITISIINKDYL